MSQGQLDCLVIGGGPGGCTAATFLALAGKRVLVLEKERFPRFHIGESLLPYNRPIFEQMGILRSLEQAGFPLKQGAQFHLGNRSKALKLVFRRGCFTKHTTAFQVERSTFDHFLLNHARHSGAEVREGWTAGKISHRDINIRVDACGPTGQTETIEASFLVDASGRANLSGNQEGLRIVHPKLKKLAVFGHFRGVSLDTGPSAADTLVVRLADKWFWLIPLSAEKVSVGCVMDQQEFSQARREPGELFRSLCESNSEMRARMRNAQPVVPIRITSDFSYYNRRLVGPRLLRVGDAAGFMDPIFSAGVYLAMHSGKLAAEAVIRSLEEGDNGAERLKAYERKVARAMKYFWVMVEKFYTPSFIELFMEPRPKFNLPDALVAILAGELEGGWKLEIRRRIFFWLLRVQRYWPLVPRVSFEEKWPVA